MKNKGITILAADVRCLDKDENIYELEFENDAQGIVDGGHTYTIITENQEVLIEKNKLIASNEGLSQSEREEQFIRQFVKVEILTGLDTVVTSEIARGLNTAVQVQELTLANFDKKFDWIKGDLANEPYLSQIAFRENENGLLDATDVLRILELFNIIDYPNDGSPRHPTRAYTGKENVLASHLKKPETLLFLRPLLKDILVFHDTVSFEARDLWNQSGPNKKGASLAFIDKNERATFEFPFIQKTENLRLFRGALFPILAAFRWMVIEDEETHLATWRGDFEGVFELWRSLAATLIEATQETSKELGRKADAIGKSSNHWKNLYNVVAFHQMRSSSGSRNR